MEEEIEAVLTLATPVLLSSTITSIILGTLINLLLVSAILMSPVLRLKLKNQIIAINCVCFLFAISIESAFVFIWLKDIHHNDCFFFNMYSLVDIMADFISSWYVVELLILYFAKLKDFDPSKKLSLKMVKIGTAVILMIPLILAGVVIPPSIATLTTQPGEDSCMLLSPADTLKLRAASTITPLLIAIVLATAGVVIYRLRFRLGLFGQSDGLELMSRGTVVDKPGAYITAVCVCVACLAVNIFFFIYVETIEEALIVIRLVIVDEVFQDAFTYLLPLSWLFLDDVRERIKTWRPWRRTRQNIDITVSYSTEEIPDETHASSNEQKF